MLKYVSLTIIFLKTFAYSLYINIDYCDKELCPYQGKHVACNNNGSFSENCMGDYWLENMRPYKALILHEHNIYRNYVASGRLKCFYPATRMPRLTWDDSLAEMAEYNVRSCVFAHDSCRNTPKYHYSGQNIYHAETTILNITLAEYIRKALFLFFSEYSAADYTLMLAHRKTEKKTGHFTLLLNDRVNTVGCAFLNNLLPGRRPRRKVIFTCNYANANIFGQPHYIPGPTGVDCRKRSTKYKSLCDDKIDPNDNFWYEKRN